MSGTLNCPNNLAAFNGPKPNGSTTVVTGGDHWRSFQMPLHYPRYKKSDYHTMPEWKLDCLLKEYGLPVTGDVSHKRSFVIGAFLWPGQN
ncbi:hypothetical protein LguiA_034383 [Lonicera macranthoides]